MSSQVNVETVKMTAGINLPNSVIVQGGVDGAFFPANQIGWGDSTFKNSTFGGTTEGLLSAIESAISNDEKVIADALSNLNTRTLNTITSYTTADTELSNRINEKVDKVEGKQLSDENYTSLEKEKLNNITPIFVGSLTEYNDKYAAGKISVGSLVVILSEDELTNSSTTAVLGKAILGSLLLGK
jgi:hypothetical protein